MIMVEIDLHIEEMIDPLTIDLFEINQSPIGPIVISRHRDPETVRVTRKPVSIVQMIQEFAVLFHHRHHPNLEGKTILSLQRIGHHVAEYCQHVEVLLAQAPFQELYVVEMI